MPYVVVPPGTRKQLDQAAGRRWAALRAARPDLGPAIDLQQRLLAIVLELTGRLLRTPLPRLSLPGKYLAAKLGRGVPVLAGEPIPLPAPVLAAAVVHLSRELGSTGAGDAGERIADAIASGRIDAATLVGASLARDQASIRMAAQQLELVPDLLWLVTELAVGPYGHVLEQALLANAPAGEALAEALAAWHDGYCPACGSWPAVAEVTQSHRVLRCGFCSAAWEMTRFACVYCGEEGESLVTAAPDEARIDRRLELCRKCGGFLKTVDVTELSAFPLVTVVDLETMDLDLAAVQHRYARPPLKTFGRR